MVYVISPELGLGELFSSLLYYVNDKQDMSLLQVCLLIADSIMG